MIFLITGAPGSGKTLSTIEKVDLRAKKENRQVYYSNIVDVKLEGWINIDKIELWYDLPQGSILFIDEFYNIFPKVGNNKPKYYQDLAVHRHKGFDIYLVCQGTQQIDLFIKDLISSHHHFKRSELLLKSKVFISSEIIDNPHKKSSRNNLETYTYFFNKKYFGCYKSADVHTHKPRFSKTFIYLFFFVFLLFCSVFYSYSSLSERKKESVQFLVNDVSQDSNNIDFQDIFKPRIFGKPSTAKVYDSLLKDVKQFPRPQCIVSFSNSCKCYTQQGTIMLDFPYQDCLLIVKNGIYYPQKEDIYFNSSNARNERQANEYVPHELK